MMKRGIKYCGGCNSRYDRVKLAKQYEKNLGCTFEIANSEDHYDEIYVFCGCTSRCVNTSIFHADKIIIIDHL